VFRGLFSCNDVKRLKYVTRRRVAFEESKDAYESYQDERTVKRPRAKNRELRVASQRDRLARSESQSCERHPSRKE